MRRGKANAERMWFGELPKGWEARRLKTILRPTKTIVGDKSGEFTLLSLTLQGVIQRDLSELKGKFPASFDTYQAVNPGDFVFCMFDNEETPRAVGLSSIRGMITGAYDVMRCYAEDACKEFLNYLFLYIDNGKLLKPLYRGMRKTVPTENFLAMRIPFPPLPVQRRIVAFLDEKTAALERLAEIWKKEISELEELKKTIIHRAVTRGIDNASYSKSVEGSERHWFGKLPERWNTRRLKHVCELIGSGTTPQSGNALFYGGNTNWIQSGDLYNTDVILNTEKHVTDAATTKCSALHIYKAPFVVVAMYGASIGNVAISKIDACVNQACCVLKPSQSFDLRFAYFSLIACKSDLLRQSAGGTQPNISQQKIREETIPFPPLPVQQRIVAYLDEKCAAIDKAIASKKKSIEELGALKSRIIADAVTGAIEVP